MTATWEANDKAPLPGGDVGGDNQASESWSVRWYRADRPGALITEYWYAEEDDDAQHYVITRQTEYLLCTDPDQPGDTEVWSDAVYDTTAAGPFRRLRAATLVAEELAKVAADSAPDHTWDGEPFHGGHTAELKARLRRR